MRTYELKDYLIQLPVLLIMFIGSSVLIVESVERGIDVHLLFVAMIIANICSIVLTMIILLTGHKRSTYR